MTNFILNPRFIFDRIADGDAYFVSKILTVPSSGSANLHIRNPHEDKEMWLAAIDITATGDQNILMHDWFDSVTDGTEVTIQNAFLDSEGGAPDTGPFEAYHGSTFTASADGSVPIGLTRSSAPMTNTVSYFPAVVEPSREIILEVDNQASNQEVALVSILLCTSY